MGNYRRIENKHQSFTFNYGKAMLYIHRLRCTYMAAFIGVKVEIVRLELCFLLSGHCVRLANGKPHNHVNNYEQYVKNIKALNSMKRKCGDLRTVTGGRRITKVKDIFSGVMVE